MLAEGPWDPEVDPAGPGSRRPSEQRSSLP
jgi:hypothetical protein